MHRMFVAGASALALATVAFGGVAFADEASNTVTPQVTIGGDYTYLGLNHGLGNVNAGGVTLSGVTPIGSTNFIVQGDAAYHRESYEAGVDVDAYNVGGSVAYATTQGRVGVAVGYNGLNLNQGGGNLNLVTYGAYGQWYATDRVTLGLKGGGASITNSGADTTLAYAGVQATGYLTRDLSVSGTYDWAGENHLNLNTASIQAAYQVSRRYPVTVFGGWSYSDVSIYGIDLQGNGVNIGVKYTFGGEGSLEHHDRAGVDSWGPVASSLRSLFF